MSPTLATPRLNGGRLWRCLWGAGLAVGLWALAGQAAQEKPNVIFILADDLGYGDLSCFGQSTLTTPHIDKMSMEGMRFTRNYSGSTVCAPSRCTLLTGKHTGHASVRGNGHSVLADTDVTIADLFKKAGYATANFGKWGVGRPQPDNPNKHGFDEFFGYVDMFHAHNFYPEFLIHNGERIPLRNKLMNIFRKPNGNGSGVAIEKIDYAPDLIREKMFDWLEAHHKKPFFLLYTPNTPHANNQGGRHNLNRGMEVPDFGPYADKKWPDAEKGFAKMILDIDADVKNIIDALKKYGIDDNTIVLFSSDNGPHSEGGHDAAFFDSNGEKRGMKRDLYEGGIRVPLIARWPGTIPAGVVNESIVAFQDLLPTVAELTRQSSPETDGISMLPKLTGKITADNNRTLYWEFDQKGGRQAILKGNMKLVRLLGGGERYELYNVIKDPSEKHTIIAKYPELAQKLKIEMLAIPDDRTVMNKIKGAKKK